MSLFEPKSIAIVGASASEGKVGHDILKNLLTQGFSGQIYPVNPKHSEILDTKTFASLTEIGKPVDMAIVVVPAKIVPSILEECKQVGVQTAVVISAGFGETHTEEGLQLEKQIGDIAKKDDKPLNVIGPNCLGVLNPKIKMNASFATALPPEGSVALVSQSGAMAVAVMDASETLGIGYSFVASIGNKTVNDESDLLETAEQDDSTAVVGLYLESISNGPRFLETASRVAQKKHIVLLKSGTSEHGSEAAQSHTGALAGSDAGIDALCKQTGIARATSMEDFLDLLEALSLQPVLPTNRIAIITNAGGPGILATDAAELSKLEMPSLSPEVEATLKEKLPSSASTKNPIDVIGDADDERYEAALEAVGNDPSIDGVAILMTPQVMTPGDNIAKKIIAFQKTYPVMPVVTSFMGDDHVKDVRLTVQKAGVPSFETPERAINALSALQKREPVSTYDRKAVNDVRSAAAAEILEGCDGLISEETTKKLFELYGIPLPAQRIATTEDEAVSIAEDIGYPVIAKVSSPHVIHKTDVGGLRAHLLTEDDVRTAYQDIVRNVQQHVSAVSGPPPSKDFRGILIQKYLEAGNEFIVGSTRDATFGHLIMAGLGGIYTELLADTAFRIAPISEEEAYGLLQDLISWKLLLGMRGGKPLDIESVASLIETVSQLVTECPQIRDIDLNPVFVHEDHSIVADAKVVVG